MRETGPKVVKGDPAKQTETQKSTHVVHHDYHSPIFGVSDSALKFTHVLYNLSPAGMYFGLICFHFHILIHNMYHMHMYIYNLMLDLLENNLSILGCNNEI